MRTRSRRAAATSRWQKASRMPGSTRSPTATACRARVEADQVAHARVGAELAAAADAGRRVASDSPTSVARSRGSAARGLSRSASPRSRSSSGSAGWPSSVEHDVAFGGRDAARRADRLAALRDARDQRHVLREGHARQAAAPDAVGDVQRAGARRRQAAEQVAAARCGRSSRRSARPGRAWPGRRAPGRVKGSMRCSGRAPEKTSKRPRGRCRQHQHQRRLVEVLDAAGGHADAHAADPGRPAASAARNAASSASACGA